MEPRGYARGMGFVRVNVDSSHVCPLPIIGPPGPGRLLAGTIWQCDACGQLWKVAKPNILEMSGLPGELIWKRTRRA